MAISSFLLHTNTAARHAKSNTTAAVVAPAIIGVRELLLEGWEGGGENNAVGIGVVNVRTSPSARVVTAVLQYVEVL